MASDSIKVPQPAIFQSDPEEQIYARGVMGDDSGLAYMFKNASDFKRGRNQETYMRGVSEANRIAAALSQQEGQQKMLIEAMKVIPDYAKAGLPMAQFPLLAQTSATGGTDDQTAQASQLVNALKQAEIGKMNAAASASNAEGGPELNLETNVTPEGVSVQQARVKIKRAQDVAKAGQILNAVERQLMEQRGIKGGGPGGTGFANSSPLWTGKTMEYKGTQRGN